MYRLMQPSDRAAVVALWQKERGIRGVYQHRMDRFAGEQNVYVVEENGQIEAVALAVPVTLQGRPGNYLFGLCGQGNLILAGLVDTSLRPAEGCGARALRWPRPQPGAGSAAAG